MESSLLKSHKPYHKICQASLNYFFTQIIDRPFASLVREFYLKLRLVGTSLITSVRGVEIDLHKDHFGRVFELLTLETSFILYIPLGLRNFKHSHQLIPLSSTLWIRKKSLSNPTIWNQSYVISEVSRCKKWPRELAIRNGKISIKH